VVLDTSSSLIAHLALLMPFDHNICK